MIMPGLEECQYLDQLFLLCQPHSESCFAKGIMFTLKCVLELAGVHSFLYILLLYQYYSIIIRVVTKVISATLTAYNLLKNDLYTDGFFFLTFC